MNLNNDNESLTQFEPLSPRIERTNAVSDFFGRFFAKSQPPETVSVLSNDRNASAPDECETPTTSVASTPFRRKTSPAITTTPATPPQVVQLGAAAMAASTPYSRSLSTVTHRISTLLTRSVQQQTLASPYNESPLIDYKQSDFRQYWMPDSRGKECYECQEKFTTFRRRHHCRICGQIFCSKCCKQEIPGRILGYMGNLRLCNYCCRAVAHHLKTPAGQQTLQRKGSLEVTGADLTSLRENLSRSFNDSGLYLRKSSNPVSGILVEESDEPYLNMHNEAPWIAESSASATTATLSRQRQSSVCSNGVLSNDINGELPLAPSGSDLPSPIPKTFDNYFWEKKLDFETSTQAADEWEPDWVKSIQARIDDRPPNLFYEASSSDQLTIDASSKLAGEIVTDHFDESVFSKSLPMSPEPAPSTRSKMSTTTSFEYSLMQKSFEKQAQKLLDYLIRRENVNIDRWRHVLWPMVQEIAFTVQPDVKKRKDDMDVLRYVHVKTIRCADTKPNAQIIFGTACTKTVTDNRMKQSFLNPHILIIGGSVEYERVEGKFCSIDPIIMQEENHLRNLVHKIASRKPDIVLVEKSVARIAQHYFRASGISLVCNLKPSVLRRIARCTQADIIHSIEGQISKPKLGSCGAVRCDTYATTSSAIGGGIKTLLCFEDCPPDLSCAIILTGPNSIELRRVKKLLKFMVAALYSSKLEMDMLQTFRVCLTNKDDLIECNNNCDSILCDICRSNFKLSAKINTPAIVENNSEIYIADEPDSTNKDLCQRRKFVVGVDEAVFYASSLIQIALPYLETVDGASCKLRSRFNLDQLYRCGSASKLSLDHDPCVSALTGMRLSCIYSVTTNNAALPFDDDGVGDEYYHPFVESRITKPQSSFEMKSQLAKFRAGGTKFFRRRREMLETPFFSSGDDKRFSPELSIDEEGTDPVLDVLDPFVHQRVAVLYCSYSPTSENAPGFCLKPKLFVMYYYGRFDVTLGDYLERYCFNPLYKCTNELCDGYMTNHIRKLVHGNSCIEIAIQNIDSSGVCGRNGDNPTSDVILAWDWCVRCKTTTSANVVSKETWHLSFSKYLEYLFNCRYLKSHLVNDTVCSCCFLHEHVHYFANKNLVVSFKTSKIILHDVSFPEPLCFVKPKSVEASSLASEVKSASDKSTETFSIVSDFIGALKTVISEQQNSKTANGTSWMAYLQELQTILDDCQTAFRELINGAHSLLAEFDEEQIDSLLSNDPRFDSCMDKVIRCRFCVAAMVQKWNILINDLIILSKKKVDDRVASSVVSKTVAPTDDSMESPSFAASSNQLNSSGGSSSVNLSAEETSPVKRVSSTDVTALLGDRKSLTKVLTTCLLTVPFDSTEHYGLPVGYKTAIVCRDTEIGSIVAYALSSDEYERTRKSMLDTWTQEGVPFTLRMSEHTAKLQANSTIFEPNSEANSASVAQHIELQFSDNHTKFYCKIYYAEHFRLLRKLLFPDGELAFLRSLSRCEQWCPKGGKSGAVFNRTLDKRFVLKQMSRFELQSFVKFAPSYFNYLSSAYAENKLTALAKIFGVFRIGFNNTQTSTAMKMDFMVMEYLFYNKNVSQVYDLKGSLRNRLAAAAVNTEKHRHATDDLVLLDENLLQRICTNSFYCYPHSKAAMTVAISNDSLFLMSNSVMDYSLLCGIDEEKHELILGIIDYMRTYTWDKRVESWVKSVSVTGQLPTIISPELYRDRFVDVFDTYFPAAPDQWTGLGFNVPS